MSDIDIFIQNAEKNLKKRMERIADPLEREDIEPYFVKRCAENLMKSIKLVILNGTDFPDRTVIYKGYTFYVECKRKGRALREGQDDYRETMQYFGAKYFLCDSYRSADAIIAAVKAEVDRFGHVRIERLNNFEEFTDANLL